MVQKNLKTIPIFSELLIKEPLLQDLNILVNKNDIQSLIYFINDNLYQLNKYCSSDYLSKIIDAIKNNNFTNVINEVNRGIDSSYLLYIGPINYFEEKKKVESLNLILLKREESAKAMVQKIMEYSVELEKELGIPCSFQNRYVEFYNQQLGLNSGNEIAVFSPFYFDKYDTNQVKGKRSIIYLNVLLERFRSLTLPLLRTHMTFDSKKSMLLEATDDEIKQSFITWITIHEMLHTSGPLPLFDKKISKLNLGLDYAGIEELRVDTTVWIAIDLFPFLSTRIKQILKELILSERLLRSARRGYWKNEIKGILSNSSDNQQGVLWFSVIEKGKGLYTEKDKININMKRVDSILKTFLNNYYNSEANIKNEADLLELSKEILRTYVNVDNRMHLTFPQKLKYFLESTTEYTTHIKLV